MIIEFVGPPGAGKSELKKMAMKILPELGFQALTSYEARVLSLNRSSLGRLITALTPQKWREGLLSAVSRRLLILHRLSFAIKNFQLIRLALGQLRERTIPLEQKRVIQEFFLRDCSFYQFFKKRLKSNEALVLSEGLVHRITSLHTSAEQEPNLEEIQNYIKLIPKADLLISVNTCKEKCSERVISRGEYRRQLDNNLTSYIENAQKTLEIALKEIRQGGLDYLEVNNNTLLHETRATMRRLLSNKFAHKGEQKAAVYSLVQVRGKDA